MQVVLRILYSKTWEHCFLCRLDHCREGIYSTIRYQISFCRCRV